MTWTVETRKTCKQCDGPISGKRMRSFCSPECRIKYHNKNAYWKYNLNEDQRARSAKFEEGKIQCLECLGWYWKVGAHITQRHGMTAREYRELHNLEVKRGITPDHLREAWGQNALDHGMDKQLMRTGARTRFKKGQEGLGKYERSPITLERLRRNQKLSPTGVKHRKKVITHD